MTATTKNPPFTPPARPSRRRSKIRLIRAGGAARSGPSEPAAQQDQAHPSRRRSKIRLVRAGGAARSGELAREILVERVHELVGREPGGVARDQQREVLGHLAA